MRCEACARGSMIEIHMTVAGLPVTFRKCSRCDEQGWESPTGAITLGRVLQIVRQR